MLLKKSDLPLVIALDGVRRGCDTDNIVSICQDKAITYKPKKCGAIMIVVRSIPIAIFNKEAA